MRKHSEFTAAGRGNFHAPSGFRLPVPWFVIRPIEISPCFVRRDPARSISNYAYHSVTFIEVVLLDSLVPPADPKESHGARSPCAIGSYLTEEIFQYEGILNIVKGSLPEAVPLSWKKSLRNPRSNSLGAL